MESFRVCGPGSRSPQPWDEPAGAGTTSEYDFRDMPFCLLGVYTGRRSRRKAGSHIAKLIRKQQVRSGHRQWEVARSLQPMSTMKERLAS